MSAPDATRWSQIESIFEAALDLPTDERGTYVRRASEGDTALEADVLSLLQADAQPQSLLDGRPLDALPDVTAADLLAEPEAARHVGPYRIVEEVGRGGMGAVYRAERADGAFEQTVALKLVKRGMDSDAVLQRFRAERQILARLDHPGIARVLDGGLDDDGRPWLAMEFVDGDPITDYADRNELSVHARTLLFQQVCEAVGYAHRQLVVHRDLKPSNVLVTPEGRVKLLDFGIAKVLAGDDDEPLTVLTGPGQLVLTPEYAAPEQVAGGQITTATDVYALGVILYELLAGRRPYAFDARTPTVIDHVVRTVQPPRPSTVVAEHPPTTGVSADRLRRQLVGDLDTICLTALRKEPDRRYTSVEAFADDLHRHRDGLPVLARPDTAGYRARKFVRRHRIGLAATVASVAAVGLVAALAFARVSAERDTARIEAAKAEAAVGFLTDLFVESDPANARGVDITARELLGSAAERIESDLSGQPEVQAQLFHVTGTVYKSLEALDAAEPLLMRALALRRQLHGPDHPDVAETLVQVGLLHERLGRYAEAAETNAEAVRILREHPETPPLLLANALHGLAFAHLRLRRLPEAEREIREALDIKRRLFGERHAEIAYSLNILGDVLTMRHRYDEAIATHQEALATRRALLGADHLHVAFSLHNLAATYRDMERYPEAEQAYREALAVWRANYPTDNQEIANTLSQLGFAVGMQGRYAEADSLYRASLSILDALFDGPHPHKASVRIRQGDVLAAEGRLAEAEAFYRQGRDIRAGAMGGEDPITSMWQVTLARLVGRQGRLGEADSLLRDAAPRCEAAARSGDVDCLPRLREVRTELDDLREGSSGP